jgi:hypothetical protein
MQNEGFSQFTQVLTGIMKNNSSEITAEQKAEKLSSILHVCTSCGLGVVKNNNSEELKDNDIDMIDSTKVHRPDD